jgi:Superinfection immunity protein
MLIAATLIYFLPTIIALVRGHLSGLAIFLLNLFLGWTLLGWIIALIWSCTGNTAANFHRNQPAIIGPDGRLVAPRSGGSLWIVLILIIVAIAIVDKKRDFRDLRSLEDPFPGRHGMPL